MDTDGMTSTVAATASDLTALAMETSTEQAYQMIGHWSITAFVPVMILVPLLTLLTALSCYWDFEYERCAVDPIDDSSKMVSEKESLISKRPQTLSQRTHKEVDLDVDATQAESSVEEQQVKKRADMIRAAHTISASHSNSVMEQSTQSLSVKQPGRMPTILEAPVENDETDTQPSATNRTQSSMTRVNKTQSMVTQPRSTQPTQSSASHIQIIHNPGSTAAVSLLEPQQTQNSTFDPTQRSTVRSRKNP